MSMLYALNYLIFAAFMTLFLFEAGIAASLLLFYGRLREPMLKYLMPIWEITGTFAVFYIVNFIASFPRLINVVGHLYIAPLLAAVMFFIVRNAALAYSEYMHTPSRRTYHYIYAVSTLVVAYIAVAVLSSGISGIGVNASTMHANLAAIMLNPFNVLVFAAVALIGLALAGMFFMESMHKAYLALAPAGVTLIAAAALLYDGSALASALGPDAWLLAAVIAALAASIALWLAGKRIARYAMLAWLFFAVDAFGAFQYPYLFGGSIRITDYLNSAAVGSAATLVTLVGGLFLTIAMVFFVYIVYIKKPSEGKTGSTGGDY